jgi:hypothetical protein
MTFREGDIDVVENLLLAAMRRFIFAVSTTFWSCHTSYWPSHAINRTAVWSTAIRQYMSSLFLCRALLMYQSCCWSRQSKLTRGV